MGEKNEDRSQGFHVDGAGVQKHTPDRDDVVSAAYGAPEDGHDRSTGASPPLSTSPPTPAEAHAPLGQFTSEVTRRQASRKKTRSDQEQASRKKTRADQKRYRKIHSKRSRNKGGMKQNKNRNKRREQSRGMRNLAEPPSQMTSKLSSIPDRVEVVADVVAADVAAGSDIVVTVNGSDAAADSAAAVEDVIEVDSQAVDEAFVAVDDVEVDVVEIDSEDMVRAEAVVEAGVGVAVEAGAGGAAVDDAVAGRDGEDKCEPKQPHENASGKRNSLCLDGNPMARLQRNGAANQLCRVRASVETDAQTQPQAANPTQTLASALRAKQENVDEARRRWVVDARRRNMDLRLRFQYNHGVKLTNDAGVISSQNLLKLAEWKAVEAGVPEARMKEAVINHKAALAKAKAFQALQVHEQEAERKAGRARRAAAHKAKRAQRKQEQERKAREQGTISGGGTGRHKQTDESEEKYHHVRAPQQDGPVTEQPSIGQRAENGLELVESLGNPVDIEPTKHVVLLATQWQEDQPCCHICKEFFYLFKRRHHCRACGANVCATCSPTKTLMLVRKGQHARQYVRVCLTCTKHFPRAVHEAHSTAGPVLAEQSACSERD